MPSSGMLRRVARSHRRENVNSYNYHLLALTVLLGIRNLQSVESALKMADGG
jgi:hypothetical protein